MAEGDPVFRRSSILLFVSWLLVGCGRNRESRPFTERDVGIPVIQADQLNISVGMLRRNDDPFFIQIPVRNVGSAGLHISEVQTSCGCLQPSISSSRLQPHETALVGLRLQREKGGRHSGKIRITSNCIRIYRGQPSNEEHLK